MGDVAVGVIPFAVSEDKSASELGGAAPLVQNVIQDSAGAMRRRPGISAWPRFSASYASGSPVLAMLPFKGYLVYVTADRKIHAISQLGALNELTDSIWVDRLAGGGRPMMVAGRALLAIAGGDTIQKWDGVAAYTSRLTNAHAGGDPPPASFLSAIAQRLVAQLPGKDGEIWWSGPLEDWENWDMTTSGGASSLIAYAKPDPLVAIADNTNELFAFGTETIQVYTPSALQIDENDPNNLLDFALARTQNVGTSAPYSIVAKDDVFGLIDRHRRALLTDARSFTDISAKVAKVLRGLERVDDAWGFRLRFGRFDCLVWMFPTDGFGLIWDANTGNWSEWREGNVGTDAVTITSAYNWPEEGVFLVGMSDGSICQLDDASSLDLTKNIAVKMETGFISRGTPAQKACRTAIFQFKRTWVDLPAPDGGELSSTGLSRSGHVRISYRDNQGPWRVLRDFRLSESATPAVTIRSVGVYRTRQWRVEYTGEDEIELVSAHEEYELLGV